jgi:lipoprotein-anchoring transpeptidase ErfK/SrfK
MGSYKQWFDREKLKEIFRVHWESFKDRYPRYREDRYEEAVAKMLGCGDAENGFATYICSKCGKEEKKVAFSCKSCFCLSCGKVYTDQWARRIEAILFSGVAYRHTVLTIPDELRDYFYRHAELLSELMRVGVACLEDTLSRVLRRSVRGGYIVVIQTNGRSGSYNPHVHIIMTAGGVAQGRQGAYWVALKYFPYEILHKKWQYYLFEMLKEKIPTRQMKALIERLYGKYPKGLVANIQRGEVPKRIKNLAKYLAKYVVSPPISVRRIERYDGQRVTYWYNDHKSGRRKEEEIDVYSFIGRMVQHILPKGMQRIRYYGLHATAVYEKVRKKIPGIVTADAAQCGESFTVGRKNYRQMVIDTSGNDPFICSQCGGEMMLWKIWHPGYGVLYDEEERLKSGYYEPVECGRDQDVGDTGHPLLQLSLPGLWA